LVKLRRIKMVPFLGRPVYIADDVTVVTNLIVVQLAGVILAFRLAKAIHQQRLLNAD